MEWKRFSRCCKTNVPPAPTPESEREALETAINGFQPIGSQTVKQFALELALHFVIKKQDENTPTLNQAFTTDDVNTLRALIQISERSLQGGRPTDEDMSVGKFQRTWSNKKIDQTKIEEIRNTFTTMGRTESTTSPSDLPSDIRLYLKKNCSNQYLRDTYPKLTATLPSPEGSDERGVGDGVVPKVLSISL